MNAALVFFVILAVAGFGQTRGELCEKYSGDKDPRIYECCMKGIEDYDECIMAVGQELPERQYTHTSSKRIYDEVMDCYASGQWEVKPCWIAEPTSGAGKVWEGLKEDLQDCYNSCEQLDTVCADACRAKFDPPIKEGMDADQDSYQDWLALEKKNKALQENLEEQEIKAIEIEETEEVTKDSGMIGRFRQLQKKAVPIVIGNGIDRDGKELTDERLQQGLGESLPKVYIGSVVDNLKEDEAFSQEFPDGLPLKRAILTPSESLDEVGMTYTFGIPKMLRERGIPDPDPARHEMQYYFEINSRVNEEDRHPFKEAMFDFFAPVIGAEKGKVTLMRYDSQNDEQVWVKMPTEQVSCSYQACEFIAVSPGTSFFAVVIERQGMAEQTIAKEQEESQWATVAVGMLILIIFLAGIGALVGFPAYFIYRKIKSGKMKKQG